MSEWLAFNGGDSYGLPAEGAPVSSSQPGRGRVPYAGPM